MGSGGKLSRRTQVVSAIAVALLFGGGWLAVWKWPHLRLMYRLRSLSPSLRESLAVSAEVMTLPGMPPVEWRVVDLGVLSVAVPEGAIEIQQQGRTGVLIQGADFELDIPDLLSGRLLADEAQSDGRLRLLQPDGRWKRVGFMTYSVAAHGASTGAFRWSMSPEQVYFLEQLLFLKAVHSQGSQGDTFVFSTADVHGVVAYPSGAGGDVRVGSLASVWVSAVDDRDCAVFYFKANESARTLGNVLASIRFPAMAFRGGPKAVEQRIKALLDEHVVADPGKKTPGTSTSSAVEPIQP